MRDLSVIPTELDVEVEIRHGSAGQDVTITLVDKLSGLHFAETVMAWDDWAAITLANISDKPGRCELRLSDKLGKKQENQTVVLANTAGVLSGISRSEPDRFVSAVERFFMHDHPDLYAEGWRVWGERSYNGHRRTENGGYSVHVKRYVEVEA